MSALETNIAEDLGFRLHHLSPGIGTEVRDTFSTGALKSAGEFKPGQSTLCWHGKFQPRVFSCLTYLICRSFATLQSCHTSSLRYFRCIYVNSCV